VRNNDGRRSQGLPFVFERFRPAKCWNDERYDGLGLGLAIVKHLAVPTKSRARSWPYVKSLDLIFKDEPDCYFTEAARLVLVVMSLSCYGFCCTTRYVP
jgi:hypothetical protein